MPTPTIETRRTITEVYTVPTLPPDGGANEYWVNPVIWVHFGANHQEIRPSPGAKIAVWWYGLTLKADIVVQRARADCLEFRYGGKAFWVVPIKAGNRKAFHFEQFIPGGKPKISYLSA